MRFFFFRFLFDGQKEIGPPEATEQLQQQKKHTSPAAPEDEGKDISGRQTTKTGAPRLSEPHPVK
jgi:hypothetical protein